MFENHSLPLFNLIKCAMMCASPGPVRMHFNFNGRLFGLMTKVIESQSAYGVCAGEVNVSQWER